MKKCTVCKEIKPLDEFYNRTISIDGKAYRCKICDNKAGKEYKKRHKRRQLENQRKNTRKHKYNLSEEDYQKLILEQKGLCAICGIRLMVYGQNSHKSDTLCVDHCHETKTVRGLLCSNCNRALGMFKDNISNLVSAIRYLKINKG